MHISGTGKPATWSNLIASRMDNSAPAIVTSSGHRWSIGDLLAHAAGAVSWLDSVGAEPTVPVPALIPSRVTSYVLALAGATSHRPLAPFSPRSTPAELTSCIGRLPGDLIVTASEHVDVAGPVASALGRRLVVAPEGFDRSRSDVDLDQDPSDVIAVMHTSGTTGLPKAVAQAQGPMALRVALIAEELRLEPGSVYVSGSAFHHQAGLGMFIAALATGAALVSLPRFSPASWRSLSQCSVTHATVSPPLIELLMADECLDLPTLRCLHYGGTKLHPETTCRIIKDHPGLELHGTFGQTEGAPITHMSHEDHRRGVDEEPDLLASVGRPVRASELRIDSPDGDGIGQLLSKAAHYFVRDPDGWLHTGDLGYTDRDDYVYIVGRQGDAINRGAETVYPEEVETILRTHRKVRSVAVAGVPDRRLGHAVAAWIIPVGIEDPPTPEELHSYTRERLAGFKVPEHWRFVEELPTNPSGKVLRRMLAL